MIKLDPQKIAGVCKMLDIPFSVDNIPPMEEIHNKLYNNVLDNSAIRLSDYEHSLIEQAFIFGIIYGANYKK